MRSFLQSCLTRGVKPGRVLHVSLPAPRSSLERFLAGAPRELGVVWYPKTGTAFAGVGAAYRIDVHGPERFVQLRQQADNLFRRLRTISFPEFKAPPPRIFGGLAFAHGVNDQAPWNDFSDGCFTLPRWCYGRDNEVVYLNLCLNADVDLKGDWRSQVLHEYDEISDALNGDKTPETFPHSKFFSGTAEIPRAAVSQMSMNRWRVLIDDIHRAIRAGEFDKIVAARCSHVRSSQPFNDMEILSRLAAQYKACYRFAFRREEASFLGASPERLFVKRGLLIESQALAGTIIAGGCDDPTDVGQSHLLLNSRKDLAEHGIVVREMVRQLGELCSELEAASKPQVRKFRNLLHLNTHIAGNLKPEVHAIDVLSRLHPTPSVGGFPAQHSVGWITEHEATPRGWYTGPVGWLGADGDAEFVVAIRCGVISGTDAYIYAGAGIVRDSEADREYFETEIKQEPLLRALGVEYDY